jgi:hypothetical protein
MRVFSDDDPLAHVERSPHVLSQVRISIFSIFRNFRCPPSSKKTAVNSTILFRTLANLSTSGHLQNLRQILNSKLESLTFNALNSRGSASGTGRQRHYQNISMAIWGSLDVEIKWRPGGLALPIAVVDAVS